MRYFLGTISFLAWLAVFYNEAFGPVLGRLWNDNTFMLWTAVIFGIWSLAWTVIDAVEDFTNADEDDAEE